MDDRDQASSVQPSTVEPPKDVDQILSEGRRERAEATAPKDNRALPEHHHRDQDAGPGDDRDRRLGSMPFAAFAAEKGRRKAAQERAAQLEAEVTELRAAQLAQQPEQEDPNDSFWIDPNAALTQSRIETNTRLSKAEFRAEYGKQALDDLENVIASSLPMNSPEFYHLSQAVQASSDPIGVAAQWAEAVLGWRPGQAVPQGGAAQSGPPAQPGPRLDGYGRPIAATFPSSLESARNVGVRRGPAWSGPDSLNDIFDRRNRSRTG